MTRIFAFDTDQPGSSVGAVLEPETAGRKQGQVTRPAPWKRETERHLVKRMAVNLMLQASVLGHSALDTGLKLSEIQFSRP